MDGSWMISQSFKPSIKVGAPRATAGGATRGSSCLKGPQQLTSLLPQSRLGLTFSGNPSFYWYVPKSPAQTAKFLLLNSDDSDVVYETDFELPQKGGIVSLALPQTVKPLEVNQRYHWFLVVGCSETDQSANPSVEGWVQRIVPDATLAKQIQSTTGRNRAVVYADNGIWHEALMTLALMRKGSPKDAQALAGWQELLRSVGLSAIATEPLLESKISQN
jgi:hypothetical protein